jgi:hypothetical protein
MWHAWERGENCTGSWWESPRERDHLKDQSVDRSMGLERILGTLAGGVGWSGFTLLRIGTRGGFL